MKTVSSQISGRFEIGKRLFRCGLHFMFCRLS